MASKGINYLNHCNGPFDRFKLGTVFASWITFMRTVHASLGASGLTGALVNELRTLVGTNRTLTNELRTRLHTGGDYQALVAAIRGELIANGQLSDRLIDLEDKAYNQIMTDPGWQEDAVQTQFECANQIDGVIDGVYTAAAVAATTTYAPTTPAWDTGVGETRLVTLSTTGVANNITATIGAIDAVIPPRPPSGQMPIGVVHIPASFTGGTTQIVAGGVTFTNGFPRRLDVHTPIATAAPAAITAPAVAAVTEPAMADVTATIPAELPDIDM